jgi:pSer/pThr/pTyr-binding forkhead associated (FHA) protein
MSVVCSLGHVNPDGSAFCDECGEPLNTAAPAPVATQEPDVTSAPDPNQVQQVQQPVQQPDVVQQQAAPDYSAQQQAAPDYSSQQADSTSYDATQAAPVAQSVAPAGLQARLIVEADNQEFDISGKDVILIGREDAVSNIYPDVDLTAHGGEEGGVSRLHARIFVENGQYMIEDENSTNFTFLNRQRLAAKTPTPLHDNDEIRLGRVLLRFKTA